MGLLESLGVKGVEGINLPNVGIIFGGIILFIVILFFAGGLTFLHYSRKIKKKQYKNLIPIFVRIHGKLSRIGQDYGKELFVPGTNISLFFLKSRKIYIARPTRAMGKDEYWYFISENGEWVNFDLSTMSEKETLAEINYDHRDTRYAYVNLQEIIKKNYKEKSVPWWKDPIIMNIVSFTIMSLIFIGGIIIVLSQLSKTITKLAPISESFRDIADSMRKTAEIMQNLNSGVVPVGG